MNNNNSDNTNNVEQTNTQVAPTIVYKKVNNNATGFLLLVILCLGGACYFFNKQKNDTISYYKNEYSPINAGEEIKLEVDSALVLNLYNKVSTTVLEDIANPEFDTTLKRYLSYRNLATNEIYSSNCNLFKTSGLKFYKCDDEEIVPKAFKEESLILKYKELFGDEYVIDHASIQLGDTCLGGYEYIAERREYVQGKCTRRDKDLVKVEKELESATSTENIIKINEKVRYIKAGGEIPSYLKNGVYTYTFRLDKNFNYIFVSKEFVGERG